jgi:hypothetical protein
LAVIRRTFIDLGMPIQVASSDRGVIVAENVGPTPLTRDEWLEITQGEVARVKEIGNWALTLSQNPQDYIVVVKATVRSAKGKTLVLLDYALDNPKLRRQGVQPSRHAPPRAVQLASIKFWTQLEKRGLRCLKWPT